MKFLNWLLKNLSTIFGIIGILVTLYVGVFYIPSWLKEVQNEKYRNAQQNIEQSIKELIYSDSSCTITELELLLEAKEIELNGKYPLTLTKVLISVQESFMQDRFLPLEQRKSLINEIELIKKNIPDDKNQQELRAEERQIFGFLGSLSAIISLIGVMIGIISYYTRFKLEKEKQEEIDNQVAQVERSEYSREYAYEFEKNFYSSIKNKTGVTILEDLNSARHEFDLVFKYKNAQYFVEIKYFTRSKVGLSSFLKFQNLLKGRKGFGWFIYNTDLTEMVKSRVEEFNRKSTDLKIKLIMITNATDIERMIAESLPS